MDVFLVAFDATKQAPEYQKSRIFGSIFEIMFMLGMGFPTIQLEAYVML